MNALLSRLAFSFARQPYFCSHRCEEEYLSVWYGEAELAAAW
jgi:hypothetical protein